MVGLWVRVMVMHLAVLVGLLLADSSTHETTHDEVYGCAYIQSSSIMLREAVGVPQTWQQSSWKKMTWRWSFVWENGTCQQAISVCVSTLIYSRQIVTGLTSVAKILQWTFHRKGLEVIEEDSRQRWHVLVSRWLAWGNIDNTDLLSQQTYRLHWVLPPATPNRSLKVGWNPSFCLILLIKTNKQTEEVKTISSWVEVIKKK